MFERWFDGHSDGHFVKKLLIWMLLIATTVQPFSLIYTAYGTNLPEEWWLWTPALATLLFIACDWTILPLGYFFATTNKPALKLMLALVIGLVAIGAFDGYFTATERMIAMRLEKITEHALALEGAKERTTLAKAEQEEKKGQQSTDRQHREGQRKELSEKVARLDAQITQTQTNQAADKAQHLQNNAQIEKMCKAVNYVCMGPKMEAELKRTRDAQADFTKELARLTAEKVPLNEELAKLEGKDDTKVDAANTNVDKAIEEQKEAQTKFDVAVLNNQVFRWAGVVYWKSPRSVTVEQANTVLVIFAASVALAYVSAQILLAVSFYGRHRKGIIEQSGATWAQLIRAMRAYYLRKRRPVYRDRVQEVFIPTSEKTRIVYVPTIPGTLVPPPEEFISKPAIKVPHE